MRRWTVCVGELRRWGTEWRRDRCGLWRSYLRRVSSGSSAQPRGSIRAVPPLVRAPELIESATLNGTNSTDPYDEYQDFNTPSISPNDTLVTLPWSPDGIIGTTQMASNDGGPSLGESSSALGTQFPTPSSRQPPRPQSFCQSSHFSIECSLAQESRCGNFKAVALNLSSSQSPYPRALLSSLVWWPMTSKENLCLCAQ